MIRSAAPVARWVLARCDVDFDVRLTEDASAERERRSTLPMPLRPSRAPTGTVLSIPAAPLPSIPAPSAEGDEKLPPGSSPPPR